MTNANFAFLILFVTFLLGLGSVKGTWGVITHAAIVIVGIIVAALVFTGKI